ncbi:uncharacterized protein LOC144951647 [Lampetra fluviatilis]
MSPLNVPPLSPPPPPSPSSASSSSSSPTSSSSSSRRDLPRALRRRGPTGSLQPLRGVHRERRHAPPRTRHPLVHPALSSGATRPDRYARRVPAGLGTGTRSAPHGCALDTHHPTRRALHTAPNHARSRHPSLCIQPPCTQSPCIQSPCTQPPCTHSPCIQSPIIGALHLENVYIAGAPDIVPSNRHHSTHAPHPVARIPPSPYTPRSSPQHSSRLTPHPPSPPAQPRTPAPLGGRGAFKAQRGRSERDSRSFSLSRSLILSLSLILSRFLICFLAHSFSLAPHHAPHPTAQIKKSSEVEARWKQGGSEVEAKLERGGNEVGEKWKRGGSDVEAR